MAINDNGNFDNGCRDSVEEEKHEKRGVRDRWNLLKNKLKKNRREEEAASGIEVDEQDEKDILIEELIDQEETTQKSVGSKDKIDKAAAEDIRNKALERLGETMKRKQEVDGNEATKKTRTRSTEGVLSFLKVKAEQELEIRKQDQKIQQQAQQQQLQQQQEILQIVQAQNEQMHTLQQQQLQQNQALMIMLQKVITNQP
ncbi:zinc finger protein 853-like [Dendronephthya gigantea]|uniref:zinc finger protein 853-like n=1 Tax=Dendronephthya gigantea TaxID=151771 RepID=UPI00106C6154|nr:zinc finger protein 853-like [Dendronephthya gigantea]